MSTYIIPQKPIFLYTALPKIRQKNQFFTNNEKKENYMLKIIKKYLHFSAIFDIIDIYNI